MTPIYLDYHSTTPVDPRIAQLMLHYLTTAFSNANSVDHIYGDKAEKAVKTSRQQIADLINASSKEIIFTSGATESINLAIQGSILGKKPGKLPLIAISPVEHKADNGKWDKEMVEKRTERICEILWKRMYEWLA